MCLFLFISVVFPVIINARLRIYICIVGLIPPLQDSFDAYSQNWIQIKGKRNQHEPPYQVCSLTANVVQQETDLVLPWVLVARCHGDGPWETISNPLVVQGIAGTVGREGVRRVEGRKVRGGRTRWGKQNMSSFRGAPAEQGQVGCHLNNVISSAWWGTITGVRFTTWALVSLSASPQ